MRRFHLYRHPSLQSFEYGFFRGAKAEAITGEESLARSIIARFMAHMFAWPSLNACAVTCG
jgi:hypothetical protein